MKKLLVIFVLLFVVVGLVGFSARRKAERSGIPPESTTLVSVEDGADAKPLKINDTAKGESGELKVTSLESDPFETGKPYNLVRGTAPAGAQRIEVNGYRLRKFMPGQTTWRYIASTHINTLQSGANNYAVRAFDRNGQEMASTNFTLVYNPLAQNLPGVGSSINLVILLAGLGSLIVFTITRRSENI